MESLSAPNMCANCGKGEEESNKLKNCGACLSVKYCSAACQAAHRPQHKKACKKRAAELHDEKLFADPPLPEECPICFLPMQFGDRSEYFQSCCGKLICNGCCCAMILSEGGSDLCAFCRTPKASSDEEEVKRVKKLTDKGSAEAFSFLAGLYVRGIDGLPQDYQKANECFLKGGELGCAGAYFNLGINYSNGRGVEVDEKKANYYYEFAAIKGDFMARHNLGFSEEKAGNLHRAFKHYIIAARAGYEDSLEAVKAGYMSGLGLVTKEEYANALRSYHERQKETKSDMRDKAAQIR